MALTGWPELTESVARAYRALPAEQQRHTVIVAENYYRAGALDVRGRKSGLPRTYSPHCGYWFFGTPPEDADTVLYVGNQHPLSDHFGQSRELREIEAGVVNMLGGNTITLYQDPKQPWHALWPRIRTI